MPRPHILFVTGKLAERSLRRTLEHCAPSAGFDFSVAVLPITVAALATTPWIARHLSVSPEVDRVILPGQCDGDLAELALPTRASIERGPKDLRDLPGFLGGARGLPANYGQYDIEIIAEINHSQRLSLPETLAQAQSYRNSGADVIDIGCDPGEPWAGVGDAVRVLRAEGMRVSIDSFHPAEVVAAVAAGAELVLSVNGTNRDWARDWGCEVVAIPDVPANLEGLDATVEKLVADGVRFRIDPVIEPIGFGFAASLGRYLEVRRRYPDAAMLMGVGNLTELTEVDSAGVNVMLLGFCQEIGIQSVLTTEVINWCRSAVRELDVGRRLVAYACRDHTLPKHLTTDLVMLRDSRLHAFGADILSRLAEQITDRNFRLIAERGEIHVINSEMHLHGTDPFDLFEQVQKRTQVDPAHAFYLGYELAKAVTALTLGKDYVQDQALRWGVLTFPEPSHHAKMDDRGSEQPLQPEQSP